MKRKDTDVAGYGANPFREDFLTDASRAPNKVREYYKWYYEQWAERKKKNMQNRAKSKAENGYRNDRISNRRPAITSELGQNTEQERGTKSRDKHHSLKGRRADEVCDSLIPESNVTQNSNSAENLNNSEITEDASRFAKINIGSNDTSYCKLGTENEEQLEDHVRSKKVDRHNSDRHEPENQQRRNSSRSLKRRRKSGSEESERSRKDRSDRRPGRSKWRRESRKETFRQSRSDRRSRHDCKSARKKENVDLVPDRNIQELAMGDQIRNDEDFKREVDDYNEQPISENKLTEVGLHEIDNKPADNHCNHQQVLTKTSETEGETSDPQDKRQSCLSSTPIDMTSAEFTEAINAKIEITSISSKIRDVAPVTIEQYNEIQNTSPTSELNTDDDCLHSVNGHCLTLSDALENREVEDLVAGFNLSNDPGTTNEEELLTVREDYDSGGQFPTRDEIKQNDVIPACEQNDIKIDSIENEPNQRDEHIDRERMIETQTEWSKRSDQKQSANSFCGVAQEIEIEEGEFVPDPLIWESEDLVKEDEISRENCKKCDRSKEDRDKSKESHEQSKENYEKSKDSRDESKESSINNQESREKRKSSEKSKERREKSKESRAKSKESREKSKKSREKSKENREKSKERREKSKERREKDKESSKINQESREKRKSEKSQKCRDKSKESREKSKGSNEQSKEGCEKSKESRKNNQESREKSKLIREKRQEGNDNKGKCERTQPKKKGSVSDKTKRSKSRSGSRSGRRRGISDDERRPRTSKGDRRKRSRSKSLEVKKNGRKHCRSSQSPDRKTRDETRGSKYPRYENRRSYENRMYEKHRSRSRYRGSSRPRSQPLACKENQKSSCVENGAVEISNKNWPTDKPSKKGKECKTVEKPSSQTRVVGSRETTAISESFDENHVAKEQIADHQRAQNLFTYHEDFQDCELFCTELKNFNYDQTGLVNDFEELMNQCQQAKYLARTRTCSDLKQMAESPEGKKLKKDSKLSLNWNAVKTSSTNGKGPETRNMAFAQVPSVVEGSLEQNLAVGLSSTSSRQSESNRDQNGAMKSTFNEYDNEVVDASTHLETEANDEAIDWNLITRMLADNTCGAEERTLRTSSLANHPFISEKETPLIGEWSTKAVETNKRELYGSDIHLEKSLTDKNYLKEIVSQNKDSVEYNSFKTRTYADPKQHNQLSLCETENPVVAAFAPLLEEQSVLDCADVHTLEKVPYNINANEVTEDGTESSSSQSSKSPQRLQIELTSEDELRNEHVEQTVTENWRDKFSPSDESHEDQEILLSGDLGNSRDGSSVNDDSFFNPAVEDQVVNSTCNLLSTKSGNSGSVNSITKPDSIKVNYNGIVNKIEKPEIDQNFESEDDCSLEECFDVIRSRLNQSSAEKIAPKVGLSLESECEETQVTESSKPLSSSNYRKTDDISIKNYPGNRRSHIVNFRESRCWKSLPTKKPKKIGQLRIFKDNLKRRGLQKRKFGRMFHCKRKLQSTRKGVKSNRYWESCYNIDKTEKYADVIDSGSEQFLLDCKSKEFNSTPELTETASFTPDDKSDTESMAIENHEYSDSLESILDMISDTETDDEECLSMVTDTEIDDTQNRIDMVNCGEHVENVTKCEIKNYQQTLALTGSTELTEFSKSNSNKKSPCLQNAIQNVENLNADCNKFMQFDQLTTIDLVNTVDSNLPADEVISDLTGTVTMSESFCQASQGSQVSSNSEAKHMTTKCMANELPNPNLSANNNVIDINEPAANSSVIDGRAGTFEDNIIIVDLNQSNREPETQSDHMAKNLLESAEAAGSDTESCRSLSPVFEGKCSPLFDKTIHSASTTVIKYAPDTDSEDDFF